MARVFRHDSGTLGAVTKTPQGGIAVDAYLTKTGVFSYLQPNGKTILEYRPPEEVFHADSLATLHDAPVTNAHPSERVNSGNFGKYAVGHVGTDVKQDGDKVAARLVIQRLDALRAVETKARRQVSCGYDCDVVDIPGALPDGTRYDRVQKNIRYNHVALVEDGRAGPEVRLRLDSSGNQSEAIDMFELIDGVKYECESDAHKAACKRRDDEAKTRQDAADAAKAELIAAQARADKAEADAKAAREELAQAQSPERLDHAVKVRNAVVNKAKRDVLGAEFKADGLDNQAVKLAAVEKAFPLLKLDGLSDGEKYAVVTRLFRAIPKVEAKGKSGALHQDASGRVVGAPPSLAAPPPGYQAPSNGRSLADIRRDAAEGDRHRKPLMMSKDAPATSETNGFPALQGSTLESMR